MVTAEMLSDTLSWSNVLQISQFFAIFTPPLARNDVLDCLVTVKSDKFERRLFAPKTKTEELFASHRD